MDTIPELKLQKNTCKSRGAQFSSFTKCHSCSQQRRHAERECRFKGFRWISSSKELVWFRNDGGVDSHKEPTLPTVFNESLNEALGKWILHAISSILLPVLEQERVHAKQAFYAKRVMKFRTICDVCDTDLFSGTWFCTSCGVEICGDCYLDMCRHPDVVQNWNSVTRCTASTATRSGEVSASVVHSADSFEALTRFCIDELDRVIPAMKLFPAQSFVSSAQPAATDTSSVPTLPAGSVSRTSFDNLWRQGGPIRLTGINTRLQGNWNPEAFIDGNGSTKVEPINCATDCPVEGAWTMETFVSLLRNPPPGGDQYKLKDFPPRKRFRDAFPAHHKALQLAIPQACQHVIMLDGIANLAAHFPVNGVVPDLGPKTYSACGPSSKSAVHGTTKLHLDVTCAFNLMTWCADPNAVGAVWHIFPAQSQAALRSFLSDELPELRSQDPIHSQTAYLSEEMLCRLQERFGVTPWVIEQRVGDMVFIPAGCAHQVHNVQSAMKIACDFVSPHNLQTTAELLPQQRQHRLKNEGHGADVLQLHTLLWYAWRSVSMRLYGTDTPDAMSLVIPPTLPAAKSPLRGAESNAAWKAAMKAKDKKRKHKEQVCPPSHLTYECLHPNCKKLFNRPGLLQHLASSHSDFYVLGGDDTLLRRENKVTREDFYDVLSKRCRFDPSLGQLSYVRTEPAE